jgi:hypothetical protein
MLEIDTKYLFLQTFMKRTAVRVRLLSCNYSLRIVPCILLGKTNYEVSGQTWTIKFSQNNNSGN